jgi:hypothetical protein
MNNQEKAPRALRYRLLAVSVGVALLLTVLVTVAACRAAADREDGSEGLQDNPQNLSGTVEDATETDVPEQESLPAASDGGDSKPDAAPVPGLAFVSNGNGTCQVAGIGSCADTFLKIPATSPTGDRVIGIDSRAFAGCTSLQYVYLPAGVTSIGEYAFDGCSSISEFAVEEGNACFITEGGVLYSRDKTAIVCYPSAKPESSYTIRDTVTQIYAGAFRSAPALKKVLYTGTVSEWASMLIGPDNGALTTLPLTCNFRTK